VQYAKNVLGVEHVIAIAGSQAKCDWLRSIGADVAINYKSPSFEKDLADATPKEVDLYVSRNLTSSVECKLT
jgi:NADPH-dependent curcumin reductase CurA